MNKVERQLFLENIGNCLTNAENCLKNSLNKVGWTVGHIASESTVEKVTCPLDPGHKMKPEVLQDHLELCSWIRDGYTATDMKQCAPSSDFFYEKAPLVVSVKLDKALQSQILQSRGQSCSAETNIETNGLEKNVPRTVNRTVVELTREERLAIYDYVAAKGKSVRLQAGFKLEDLHTSYDKKGDKNDPKSKSHLEILAEQRDYKRRRQSYRAKNVHITNKSYTEIMRDVIENMLQTHFPEALGNGTCNNDDDENACSPVSANADEEQNRQRTREVELRNDFKQDYKRERYQEDRNEHDRSGSHSKRHHTNSLDRYSVSSSKSERRSRDSHHKKNKHKKHHKHKRSRGSSECD